MVRYLLPILFFVSCSSTANYKWYALDLPSYEQGSLLGPKKKDDLPVKVCEPDEFQKGKCIVLLVSDFERIYQDYNQMRIQLRHLEKNCGSE